MDSTTTYETFSFSGKSSNCYGLELVKDNLTKRGFKVLPFDSESKNPVLVSLFWPEQIYNFIKWRYRQGLKGRKIYVGGNFPTTSPNAVLPFCDGVFLGDGELWDGKPGGEYFCGTEPVKKAVVKAINPIPYEDVQFTRRYFVEISRGCKNKCLFCQYGWLKDYREASVADAEQVIRLATTKTLRVFAADRFQHTGYSRIRQILDKSGKNDNGSDVSMKSIFKNPEYLKYTNKVRVGIEGMSHRLRKLVGKDYSDEQIVEFCKLVKKAGIKSFDWYMIYGLPTETDEDAERFEELIAKIDVVMPIGYTLAIHWNAFTPSAQTPFQWAGCASGEFKGLKKFFTKRPNKRIKVYHKPKLTSDATLLRRMLAIRGDESTKKLVYNFAIKETQLKKHPDFIRREFEKSTGADLTGKWPFEKPLPWDKFCIYKKGAMKKVLDRSMEKFGG